MTSFYNDNHPATGAWLQALVNAGELPSGRVQVCDVTEADPDNSTHCHWFAGIGGWPLALKMIGWPDATPVWTASLPCQSFSSAGKQRGFADDRHLWPAFRDHIAKHNPPILFGEQTQSKLGRDWLATVQDSLEALGYRTAAADLCGPLVGAPHQRQRLYWMAYAPGWRERSYWEAVQRTLRGCDNLSAFWAESLEYVDAGDGRKLRPVKPGIQLMADGLPSRVVLSRGVGNAIVPQVAALFIKSSVDALIESS